MLFDDKMLTPGLNCILNIYFVTGLALHLSFLKYISKLAVKFLTSHKLIALVEIFYSLAREDYKIINFSW